MSNILTGPVDEVCDLGGRFGLHPRDHVRVLLERERRRLVAEPLADHLDRDASPESERSVRVAEVVKSDRPQTGLLDQPFERLAERVRVDRLAVLLRYDEVVVLVVGTPLGPLAFLAGSMGPQLRDRLVTRSMTRALWLLGVEWMTS
jgi:hypothetical protein